MIELAQLQTLPVVHQRTIPSEFLDEMGHMNVMYYMHLFDRGAWGTFRLVDLDIEEMARRQVGMFALRHYIQYLAEVRVNEMVKVRSRFLAISQKRVHFMMFLENETRGILAATLEALATNIDMHVRRSAPIADDLRNRLQDEITKHEKLGWDAPTSGILQP